MYLILSLTLFVLSTPKDYLSIPMKDQFRLSLAFEKDSITANSIRVGQNYNYTLLKKLVDTNLNIVGTRKAEADFGTTLILEEVNDFLLIDNQKVKLRCFVTSNYFQVNGTTCNRLSLSYHMINKEYSFIHQLKESHLISKLQYTFQPYNSYTKEGFLHFGGVPKKIKEKNSRSCKVDESKNLWGCHLGRIYLGEREEKDTSFNVDSYSTFQSENLGVIAPRSFFDFIKKKVLFDFFKNQTCLIFENEISVGISCICDFLSFLPNITFVFDSFEMRFNLRRFFSYYYDPFIEADECELLIFLNKEGNHWIFGNVFLKLFEATFDYDNNQIVFYSNNIFVDSFGGKSGSSVVHFKKMIYVFLILVNSAMILALRISKTFI